MTGTNEQLAEERIGSRLPLRVTPTGLGGYGWIGLLLLFQLPFVIIDAVRGKPAPDILGRLLWIAAPLLISWLFIRLAATKWRTFSGVDVVVTDHALEFPFDGTTIPYCEIRKIEPYTNRTVWMFLHNGGEVSFSIAGLSKEDRPLLLAWLQERIGADVFA